MSTSFRWKQTRGKQRKTSLQVAAVAFEERSDDEEDNEVMEGAVDWLTMAKRRRGVMLEDSEAKGKRLQEEGMLLAENERSNRSARPWVII